MFNRRIILSISMLFISGVLCLLRFGDIPVGSFYDDAHYIILAESLGAGRGYHLINQPQAPTETAFPPGWPLLLTPLVKLFPGNFTVLKALSLCFWLATIPLVYKLFAERLEPPMRLGLVALVATNGILVGMSGTVMSEAAYLFFALLTLIVYERGIARRDGQRTGFFVLALILALCAVAIRTIGIAMLGALLVHAFLRLRWRNLRMVSGITCAVLCLGILPLAWFNGQRGGALVFSPLYQQHVEYVTANLIYFVRLDQHLPQIPYWSIATAWTPMLDIERWSLVYASTAKGIFSGLVLLSIGAGFILSLRQNRATEYYVFFYAIILYVWIIYTDELRVRLLIPLLPFGYFYLLRTVGTVAQHTRMPDPLQRKFVYCSLGILLLANLGFNAYVWARPAREQMPDIAADTRWLQEHTPAHSVVMTADPIPDYLFARRQTVAYPDSQTRLDDYIQRHSIDYIAIHPHLFYRDEKLFDLSWYASEELLPNLHENPERFSEVYSNPENNFFIFQVVSSPR